MSSPCLTFTLDLRDRLVRVTGEGATAASDWIALFDRVLSSSGHEPGMDFLVDRRRVTSVPSRQTVDDIVRYYASHGEQLGRCKLASVTDNDAAYGMNRVAEVFAEQTTVTVRVFRDLESAYDWLRPAQRPAA